MDQTLIEKFIVDEIIPENMSSEDKKEILESFCETIFLASIITAAKTLNQDDRNKLEEIVESANQKTIANFIMDKVPNFDDILTNEALKFKQSLLERFKKTKEELIRK